LINIVVEATVFLPLVLLVSNGYVGTVTYGTLIWIDVIVETCRLAAMFYVSKDAILSPAGDDDLKLMTVDKSTDGDFNDAEQIAIAVEVVPGGTSTGDAETIKGPP
jgi:hypothetical protein